MTEHSFGGGWTEDKLSRLGKYLTAYRTIYARNERAKYFTTWYVEAFAGTGSRSPVGGSPTAEGGLFDEVYRDPETTRYRDGSARIALGLASPFHHYLFIEKSKKRVTELKASIQKDFPKRLSLCDFKHGDANVVLKAWCRERNWRKERAVVFLDPYGMQVDWDTIEVLAATKAIDLWYLFPLGVGVARLLTRDGTIDLSWQKRLDSVFGTNEWRSRFYETRTTQGLFGAHESVARNVTVDNVQAFIQERLARCFPKVAEGLVLRNSKSSPLYSLCFAAANARGASTALRIAQSILDDPRV
jgi:three-Cys-motif partner protein